MRMTSPLEPYLHPDASTSGAGEALGAGGVFTCELLVELCPACASGRERTVPVG